MLQKYYFIKKNIIQEWDLPNSQTNLGDLL